MNKFWGTLFSNFFNTASLLKDAENSPENTHFLFYFALQFLQNLQISFWYQLTAQHKAACANFGNKIEYIFHKHSKETSKYASEIRGNFLGGAAVKDLLKIIMFNMRPSDFFFTSEKPEKMKYYIAQCNQILKSFFSSPYYRFPW